MDWKEMMFKEHVSAFVEILGAKQISVKTDSLDALLGQRKKTSILDLGCGTGRLLAPLSSFGSSVVGLDYSESLLLEATKRTADLHNTILLKGDMTKLTELFLPGQFDLIIRAYTSLGYFPNAVESQILSDCHNISSPNAVLIVDTFNADWFKVNKFIQRETDYGNLILKESYTWDEASHMVKCNWQYVSNDLPPIEIPFDLEGYDIGKMDHLLHSAGWQRTVLIDSLDSFVSIDPNSSPERLIVVAQKNKKPDITIRHCVGLLGRCPDNYRDSDPPDYKSGCLKSKKY